MLHISKPLFYSIVEVDTYIIEEGFEADEDLGIEILSPLALSHSRHLGSSLIVSDKPN